MASSTFDRIDWQRTIFALRPGRSELIKLKPVETDPPITVRIHRNTTAEYAAAPMESFLAFCGFSSSMLFGPYDDSLAFRETGSCDIEIVWQDWSRYLEKMDAGSLVEWASTRISELRKRSDRPILVLGAEPPLDSTFDDALIGTIAGLPDVRVVPRLPIAEEMEDAYFDSRFAQIGATTRSDAAFVAIARELGLRWIPAAVWPRLKAIAVDLDNTLYKGTLGEDGCENLVLTPSHAELQRRILGLRDEGILLALVSRNEPADVEALFRARADFPLRREHFSAFEVGWGSKADALDRAAGTMRIGIDSILFVDDNIGELATVAAAGTGVALLHASDPVQAVRGLRWFPGLARWGGGSDIDGLRQRDLAANKARGAMARGSSDTMEYLRSLKARIVVALRRDDQIPRVAELSGKTNQFNLSLRRFTEIEIHKAKDDPAFSWATVDLSDRLSDSGIILSVAAKAEGDRLIVEDLCISCRALGRGLEDLMVTESLNRLAEMTDVRRIAFRYASGPRNEPAREWLSHFIGENLDSEGEKVIPWNVAERRGSIAGIPVVIERR